MKINKQYILFNLLIFLLSLIFTSSHASTVLALSNESGSDPSGRSQRYVIEQAPWFDPTACETDNSSSTSTTPGGLGSGSKVYILGDSITVSATETYKKQFEAKGITPTISAVVGRSWTTPGGGGTVGTPGTGQEAVDVDAQAIKDANGIIIALGTNGTIQSNPISDIVTKIQSINNSAPIWWVNVANGPPGNTGVIDFNKKLQTETSIKVIDWSSVVDPGGDGTNNPGGVLGDATHPSIPDGVNKLVELVVNTTTSGGSNTSSQSSSSTASATASPSGGITVQNVSYGDYGATYYIPSGGGQYPLVVFSPGRHQTSEENGMYSSYLRDIASSGFVVVGTNLKNTEDIMSQSVRTKLANNIKDLITRVDTESIVKDKINKPSGIASMGHSDGGMVVTELGYSQNNKDQRITAVVAMSGSWGSGSVAGPPLLAMVGDQDGNQTSVKGQFNNTTTPYSAFTLFKGGSHAGIIQNNTPHYPATVDLTKAFLNRMLKSDNSEATRLPKVVESKYSDKVIIEEKGDTNLATGSGTVQQTSNFNSGCICDKNGGGSTAGSDFTNFNPDPQAVQIFNDNMKATIERLTPYYKKGAEAAGLKDWEIMPALHWLETGLGEKNITNSDYVGILGMSKYYLRQAGGDPGDPVFAAGKQLSGEDIAKQVEYSIKFFISKSNPKIDLSKSLTLEDAEAISIKYKSGSFYPGADPKGHAYAWAGFDQDTKKLPMPWGPGWGRYSDQTEGLEVIRPGAVTVFALLKSGGVLSAGGTTQPPTGCTGSNGGLGVFGNFTFPLKTTKAIIEGGNKMGLIWCSQTPDKSCHGDYPAADIAAPTGTEVVAAVSGTVQDTNDCTSHYNKYGCSVTIIGSTDSNVYFYTHMLPNSITVSIGQEIQAGQKIGEVGRAKDAENTSPHLHFDITSSKYNYRASCVRGNCPIRSDMIDVQPMLYNSFQVLPDN